MRHQKKIFKLGRIHSHRKATLAALSTALIREKRITTTVTKAKALRIFVEPLINRSKTDSLVNRRHVFRHLQDKESVKELFGEISEKVGDRQGGYTRIVRLGQRSGDAADMAIIELVDYNDQKPDGAKSTRRKTRRAGRRKKGDSATPKTAQPQLEATETKAVVEPVVEPDMVEKEVSNAG